MRCGSRALVVWATLSLGAWLALGGTALGAAEPRFLEDRVIVKLRPEVAGSGALLPEAWLPDGIVGLNAARTRHGIARGFRLVREHGLPIRDVALFRRIGLDRIYVLELPVPDREAVKRIVRELAQEAWVEYAQPMYVYDLLSTVPNDPMFSQQWQHHNTGQTGGKVDADIDSPLAWDLGTGAPSAVVALLDSGVDLDHPDLVANLLPGIDFTSSPEGIQDIIGHGTSTAGTAAARGNNGQGVAGVCWNCSILPVKVFGSTAGLTLEQMADGVRWAADNGADVINLSFGTTGVWDDAFEDAIEYAENLGTLTLAAAGNDGTYSYFFPAASPHVVSVGGTTQFDVRYGNYGDHAEVAAPEDFMTTKIDGYAKFNGTSAAAPVATGLAALLRATDPGLHPQELRQLLRLGAEDQIGPSTEDTAGWDPFFGYGRINANDSMSLIDGPWLALDRPHYVCAGSLAVDLKDTLAGPTVDVTLHSGSDVETVQVVPVTAEGYRRGTIDLSWVGHDGPLVVGNGKLDVANGGTITATAAGMPMQATAFLDCTKRVCLAQSPLPPVSGDCDQDGNLDPGEIWRTNASFTNLQTQLLADVEAELRSSDPNVQILQPIADFERVIPEVATDLAPFRFRVAPGSPANGLATLTFVVSGNGFAPDVAGCNAAGHPPSFQFRTNRDGVGAETWPAFPPSNLAGSVAGCPGSFGLTWSPVANAQGYNIYRSEVSCADAEFLTTPIGTSATTSFTDTGVVPNVNYFYAVEAVEPGTHCVSERACVTGSCVCDVAGDPAGLLLDRAGDDVLLSWTDPATPGVTWNVYRDSGPNPAGWGPPLHAGASDEDGVTAGIQFTDQGAVSAGPLFFYLITAQNDCGESAL
jgi:thermitase